MKADRRDERKSVLLSLTSYTEPLKQLHAPLTMINDAQICIGGGKISHFSLAMGKKLLLADDGAIQSTFHGYKLMRKE